ncbi:MAG: hypothetical protein AAF063_28740 [Cyanobacteria bacterium J06643_5]
MSQQTLTPNNHPNDPKILATFASLLGVLAVFLYFTGWIYRWAYFNFFQLDITTLDLPLESFFIVPFQVFLGNFWALSKTLLAIIASIFLINISLWLLNLSRNSPTSRRYRLRNAFGIKLCLSRLPRNFQIIYRSSIAKNIRTSINIFPQSLCKEAITVIWILVILFWLARSQGITDARKDAINETSARPVVTLITKKDNLGLGRKPESLSVNPSLKDFHVIGDVNLLENIKRREITDMTIQPPRVWRSLIERNGWIYIFQALPSNITSRQRPLVLAIRESGNGDQLLILSPETSKKQSN